MSPKLWSDEDRLFIPRMGGWTINFKHVARKFGWVKTPPTAAPSSETSVDDGAATSQEDRLKKSLDASRYTSSQDVRSSSDQET